MFRQLPRFLNFQNLFFPYFIRGFTPITCLFHELISAELEER